MAKGPGTKEQLLLEATRQFAARGFDRVSVRDVTEAVGANVASISYHFGGRDGLVKAVLERYLTPVFEERRERLSVLPARVGARKILRAWVEPLVEASKKVKPGGQGYFQLACQSLEIVEKDCPSFVRARNADLKLFADGLQARLPGLSANTVHWRMFCSMEVLLRALGRRSVMRQALGRVAAKVDTSDLVERLLDYCEAGLSAPVTVKSGADPEPIAATGEESEFLF